MDLQKYLRKKERLQSKREEKLRLSIGEEVFEFEKLTDDKYNEIQGKLIDVNQNGDNGELMTICRDVMYFSCPDLRSAELQSEFGVAYPPDIVNEIFSSAEISAAGAELMTFNGMTETDIVKKV